MDIVYHMNTMEEITSRALDYLSKAGCREYVVSSIQNHGIVLDAAKKGKRQVFKVERAGKSTYFSPGDLVTHLITTARRRKDNIQSEAQLEEMLEGLIQELSNIPKDA